MRRIQLGLMAFAVPMLGLSLVLVGCNKGEQPANTNTNTGGGPSNTGGPGKGAAELKPIDAKYVGTLKGRVLLKGTPPDLAKMTKDLQKKIDENKDKGVCLAGRDPEKEEQSYRIGGKGNDKTVANVFVWIEPVDRRTQFFKVPDEVLKEVPKEVVVHQPHCAFLPHCLVLFPDYRDPANPKKMISTKQQFKVVNDASVTHNTKWEAPSPNGEGNPLIAAGDSKVVAFKPYTTQPPKAIELSCNIHGWMRGYVRVFDHPYAAVTLDHNPAVKDPKANDYFLKPDDERFGTYEIKGVPEGAKVRVIAWHEKAEFLAGPKGKEVTLEKGKPTVVDFDLEAK